MLLYDITEQKVQAAVWSIADARNPVSVLLFGSQWFAAVLIERVGYADGEKRKVWQTRSQEDEMEKDIRRRSSRRIK